MTWIETWACSQILKQLIRSHPAGVRGLKPHTSQKKLLKLKSRTFHGAWIEITEQIAPGAGQVTPFTGAWIETVIVADKLSHPVGVRGLKRICPSCFIAFVAPRRGAWIETCDNVGAFHFVL